MQTKPILAEIMSTPVVSVPPGSHVAEVMALAARKGVHHFPVVAEGALVGLVCTCDLRRARPSAPVGDLIMRSVVTLPVTSSASDAARVMANNAVGSAVILAGAELAGIVTRADLAAADPELAALLVEGHCVACGSAEHLRPGPDGTYLCVGCSEQSRPDDWFCPDVDA